MCLWRACAIKQAHTPLACTALKHAPLACTALSVDSTRTNRASPQRSFRSARTGLRMPTHARRGSGGGGFGLGGLRKRAGVDDPPAVDGPGDLDGVAAPTKLSVGDLATGDVSRTDQAHAGCAVALRRVRVSVVFGVWCSTPIKPRRASFASTPFHVPTPSILSSRNGTHGTAQGRARRTASSEGPGWRQGRHERGWSL